MNRSTRIAAGIGSLVLTGALSGPAVAQSAAPQYFEPAKLIKKGSTNLTIPGSGTVIVQVEVHTDGTHKAVRVLHTTNPADNAAALDIAQHSEYNPATRGGKPVISFYDFTLKFAGGGTVASDSGSSGQAEQIGRMIRAGNYAGAKAKATEYLATNPSDSLAQQELGVANYFLNDAPSAADAFAKANSISRVYANVAAHAYAAASTQVKDPQLALSYAKRALDLDKGANSYYAVGSAELNAGDAQSAVTDLQKARDLAFADSHTDQKEKINLDEVLYAAYAKNNDLAHAQEVANELRQLDPANSLPQRLLGNQYLNQGNEAAKGGNHEAAISAYLQAASASSGDTAVVVTAYTSAAMEEGKVDKADYAKMKSYADQALAAKGDDPTANFAEGIALAGQWASGGSKDKSLKDQSMSYLNKAKSLAQAAGNTDLVASIDTFIKNTFK